MRWCALPSKIGTSTTAAAAALLGALAMYNVCVDLTLLTRFVDRRSPARLSLHFGQPRGINDKTLPWDPTVRRPWLTPDLPDTELPPAMLLLTTYGWNQSNRSEGMRHSRSIRETELMAGIVNHPWFHPTKWDDINKDGSTLAIDRRVRYYVFIDMHYCGEKNYPIYSGGGTANQDGRWNRATSADGPRLQFDGSIADHYGYLLQARVFRESRNATAILFDCSGAGLPPDDGNDAYLTTRRDLPLSFATMSSLVSRVDAKVDQGLPPPVLKRSVLTDWQEEDIATCEAETNRTLHAVYIGNGRNGQNSAFNKMHGGARSAYFPFHDNNRTFFLRHFLPEFASSAISNLTYEAILSRTVFGLAPRGDNKYSYRFSEVLSAGTIPVVHADDWVWPFRPELVDWNECAVILPERDAGRVALEILDRMSLEERCRRRQRCYGIYKKYVRTTEGTIRGLVDGLELVAEGKRLPMVGIHCTHAGDPHCNSQR